MDTRNTTRRVLRSDTAPVRQQLDGNRNTADNRRMDRLERQLDETRDEIQALSRNINATVNNMGTTISAEIADMKQSIAGLVQSTTNLVTGLGQVQQTAQTAARLAAQVTAAQPAPAAQAAQANPAATGSGLEAPPAPAHASNNQAVHAATPPGEPKLRKMDTKPPVFHGEINGIKLKSFIFQFEQYFKQKGYNLTAHDDRLCDELNQCVQHHGLVWYERYMSDTTTTKTWSAAKLAMQVEFMEPNFKDKIRNQLLTIKQTGSYAGYVGKFRELNCIAQIDAFTAMDVFLNGLSDVNMKREILRKKPANLDKAIEEGYLEWELKDKISPAKPSNAAKGKGKSGGEGNASPPATSQQNAARKTGEGGKRSTRVATKCPFCKRGYHKEEDCWVKFPDKRPTSSTPNNSRGMNQKIFALLERLVVQDDSSHASSETSASNE